MARKYQNFISGTLSAGITSSDTTLSSTGLASMMAIANPDTLTIVLDPLGVDGAPEIVHVTAHSGGASAATVLRAREGTTARSHNQNTAWVATVTDTDFERLDTIEANGWVTSARIIDGAVVSTKIDANAVTAGKLASGAVNNPNLFSAGVIDSAALGAGSVTSGKLGAGAVTSAALAGGAVTSSALASGAVGTSALVDGAVTQSKLAGSVTLPLAAGSVGPTHIASGNRLVATTVGSVSIARYAGSLDGNGTFSVSHGLGSDALRRLLAVQAWYRGASGEAKAFDPEAVTFDASTVTGGAGGQSLAGRSFYVVVFYTDAVSSPW